jgi:hypothetical protein
MKTINFSLNATLALFTAAYQNNKKQDKTPITKPKIPTKGILRVYD